MSGRVGGLSAAQAQSLERFRSLLSSSFSEPIVTHCTDVDLMRFLRARSFNVEAAFKQWDACRQWREENGVEDILNGPFPLEDELSSTLSCAYYGEDKKHRPLYVECSGAVDAATVARLNRADLVRRHIYHQELQVRRVEESAARQGDPAIDCWCEIHDMQGLSMQHRQVLGLFTHLARLDTDFYPERAGKIFFVNVPTVFPALWKICRRALDAKTREKFVVLSSSQTHELLKYFDADQLPVQYGGTATDALRPLPHMQRPVSPLPGVKLRQVKVLPRRLCLRTCSCASDEVVTWYFRVTSKAVKFSVRWTDNRSLVDHDNPVQVRQWLAHSMIIGEASVAVGSADGGVKDSYMASSSGVLGLVWENDSVFQSRDVSFQLSVDKHEVFVRGDDSHVQEAADVSDASVTPGDGSPSSPRSDANPALT